MVDVPESVQEATRIAGVAMEQASRNGKIRVVPGLVTGVEVGSRRGSRWFVASVRGTILMSGRSLTTKRSQKIADTWAMILDPMSRRSIR